MARCVIFCAAGFTELLEPIGQEDYIVAADGGFAHVQKLGLSPDLILGDFDSLGYTPAAAQVFPCEKDDTDTMLAIRQGLKKGCREFLLYGSLDGPRLDHTVANFQVLQYLAEHGAVGYLIGNTQIVTLVRGDAIRFPAGSTGILSVFSMGDAARGVQLKGLAYPLSNGTLSCGFPLGVSNQFTAAPAEISTGEGSLLVIYQRENGLPLRSHAHL